ncbi:hypothetical protein D3C73_1571770 [compost metagenome]
MVVANDNRWNKWMLKDGENCKISKPSITSLSETIIESLKDKSLREQISKTGTKYILENQSDWDKEFRILCDKMFT